MRLIIVKEEFDEVQLKSGAKGVLSFIAQARDWETQGEYMRAIQCYMKVKESETADTDMIVNALQRVIFCSFGRKMQLKQFQRTP